MHQGSQNEATTQSVQTPCSFTRCKVHCMWTRTRKGRVFKYLSRLLTYDDNDIQNVRSNLKKARIFWARISQVLKGKNMFPKVCGMFYKTTIQAVLLYRSKLWNLNKRMMRMLESFHLRAAYCMTKTHKSWEDDDEIGLIHHQRTYSRK